MAVLDLVTIPSKILKQTSTFVNDVSNYQTLIDDMLETMYDISNAIGLAANQVGRKEAIAVIDISENRDDPLILVNPKIVAKEEIVNSEEGCLSVPNYRNTIPRYKKVKVEFLDRNGSEQVIETDTFLAIVIQHEVDHLNGKVYIDYLSPLKQEIALKKVKKYLKK